MALKILLVDDERALLQLLQKHLARLGHDVEVQETSTGALSTFAASPEKYDLVIADLGMPDMSGDELLRRMLEIRPATPVLVCSGTPYYLANLPTPPGARVGFLQKPFLPKMLTEAINDLLAGGKQAGA